MKRGVEDPQVIGVGSDKSRPQTWQEQRASSSKLRLHLIPSLNPRANHLSDNRTSTAELEAAFYCWKNFSTVQIAGLVQQATID